MVKSTFLRLVCLALVLIGISDTEAQQTSRSLAARTLKAERGSAQRAAEVVHGERRIAKATELYVDIDLGPAQLSQSGMPYWPGIESRLPSGVTYLELPMDSTSRRPVLAVTFAIPSDVSRVTPRSTVLGSTRLSGADASTLQRYTQASVTASEPQQFRSLRTVTITIPLVTKSGASAIAATKLRASINFSSEVLKQAATSRGQAAIDPLFVKMNSGLVVNRWDLDRFASPLRAHAPLGLSATTRPQTGPSSMFDPAYYTWIDPSASYMKLSVTRDGLYRVSMDELRSRFGFDARQKGWTVANLHCINHGVEVPLWIDSSADGTITSIEFYGERLRGEGGKYYNDVTDTNVYWLTSSARTGTPARYVWGVSSAPSGTPIVSTADVTLHHERDFFTYDGDVAIDEAATRQRTQVVDGEGFVWYLFNPPNIDSQHPNDTNRVLDSFYVALPTPSVGLQGRFRIMLRGMGSESTGGPGHHAIARLNNEFLGEVLFDNTQSASIDVAADLTRLRNGLNTLEILSAGTEAKTARFYLDNWELSMPSAIAPSMDTAIARNQEDFTLSNGAGLRRITAPAGTDLYNLTERTRLVEDGGAFLDQLNGGIERYAGASPSAFLAPARMDTINVNGNAFGILSKQNAADYIVITHPLFRDQAEKLRIRRTAMGLRSMVVTTDEVFNAFNGGSNEPDAFRRFLRYAYDNYAGAPVGFVTLFGDASYDPKYNLNNTLHGNGDRSTQQSFVLTYGNPVSDYYYTLINDGDIDTTSSCMLISRVPVSTPDEAESFVEKLVEYENARPADWNHRFLFITGGDPGLQHNEFNSEVEGFLKYSPDPGFGYVGLSAPPTNIRGKLIERTFFGDVDATHVGEIQSEIQRGVAFMYFTGHGATFITDVLLGDPNYLRNRGLYPTLMTLSCRTGAFAEPNLVSLNESYLRAHEQGAIMAFGTTGYGQTGYDYIMSTKIFSLMRTYHEDHDTTHAQEINLAAIFTAAKIFAVPGFGYVGLNSRLQYSILGDAAMGFCLRPQPEFAVSQSDLSARDGAGAKKTVFSITDSLITISALIHNHGYSAERPVPVMIQDIGPNSRTLTTIDTLSHLDDTATVYTTLRLTKESIGEHTISVVVDPGNVFPETHKEDDSSNFTILVNGISSTPFYPYDGGRGLCEITGSTVHLIVVTPSAKSTLVSDRIQVEIDTSIRFDAPYRRDTVLSRMYTEFDADLRGLPVPSSGVYWWRTRVEKASGEASPWQLASFSTRAGASSLSLSTPQQLAPTIQAALTLNSSGSLQLPVSDTVVYDVIAHGINDSGAYFHPVSQVLINNKQAFDFTLNGYAVLTIRPDNAGLADTVQFEAPKYGDSAAQGVMIERFDSVIRAIPTGRRVIVLTRFQPQLPWFTYDQRTREAMQSLGSLEGFQKLGTWGSVAFIGRKGDPPGSAKEMIVGGYSNGAEVIDTLIASGTSGTFQTPLTAVALSYDSLRWAGELPSGSEITFHIIGQRHGNANLEEIRQVKATESRGFDLSGIDAKKYERLAIRGELTRGTVSEGSPTLQEIVVGYQPAPELYFEEDSITISPNTIRDGGKTVARYTVHALTCTAADQYSVLLQHVYQGKLDTVYSHTIDHLEGHGSVRYVDSIDTRSQLGSSTLTAYIDPDYAKNEQLTFNDAISGSYSVIRDTVRPLSEILVDHRHIPQKEYVSSRSTISINLYSQSNIRQIDTASISARLLNFDSLLQIATISASNPGDFTVRFVTYPSGPLQTTLEITPKHPLAPGTYEITAYAHDASGNAADTIVQSFVVSATNGIEHVMNYPNPFKERTDFTFVLRSDVSASAPAEVKILVYTVAGRKIKTLTPTKLVAGLNRIAWDGRDEEGNDVANGTYLYRVVLNGHNLDGSDFGDGITEKLVRSR